ncbi:MAG: type II secretion system protein GspE, partial [Betaproteobacteria bacterium]|nr:type II secretion system protein GspE [Betaproteobacteria bacterium]
MEPVTEKIGELLVARSKLDTANLERALKVQEAARAEGSREKLGAILTRLGMLSGRDLAEALAQQRGWAIAEADEFPELPILEETISARFIQEAHAIPLHESETELVLAMLDPADTYTLQAFGLACHRPVRAKLLTGNDFDLLFERLYGGGKSSMGQIVDNITTRDEDQEFGDIEQLKDLASEAPVIRL